MTLTRSNMTDVSTLCPPIPISPLDIPELFQLVFSFIDGYYLRTAVLVCRKWFLLNHDRLRREVTWDLKWQPSKPSHALVRLPGAERLVVICQSDHTWPGLDLHAALSSLDSRPSTLWLTLTSYLGYRKPPFEELLHRPLREIVLKTGFNFKDGWLNHLPFPPSLTSVTIDKSQVVSFNLARILVLCPSLLSLHISSAVFVTFTGRHIEQGLDDFPGHLSLRSLVLKHLLSPQLRIEDLLTTTPDLEELQLISISNTNGQDWNWPNFRDHLQSLSLPLKTFHYSMLLTRLVNTEQEEEILAVCPHAKERTLLLHNLTPRIISRLTEQSVVLTTLEIILPSRPICQDNGWLLYFLDHRSGYSAYPLHRLLCEGSTLRHLKTLKMPYMTDFMDLFHRNTIYVTNDSGAQETSLPNVPGIWTCRGLQTLHLELHIHGPRAVSNFHYMRVVCGYVSRVCQHLQDLHIGFSTACPLSVRPGATTYEYPLHLEGGLCLLSRLKCLERLCLGFQQRDCGISEVSWLCPSGRTEKERKRRRIVVEHWTQLLQNEAVQESGRLESITLGERSVILGMGTNDVELLDSMKNLGLLQDVKEMVDEMDKDGFVCLPELRRLGYCGQLEQHPERVIKSVFYERSSAGLGSWFSSLDPFS